LIPLSLTLRGFYSYREETTIDFTPLTAAGLFGIFGQVGSGKSSIPDAIGFALYDKSERLNRGEKKHYMHITSHELLVDFEFRHLDGHYRFQVHGKRSKGGEGSIKYSRSAYRKHDGEWVPFSDGRDNDSGDASGILGLSYENFRRAVVIPQGSFQEFLRLTGKERTDMLQELFQLDRFDLFAPVNRLYSENRRNLDRLGERMRALEGEQLIPGDELKSRIEVAESEAASAAENLERLRKDISLLEEAKEKHERLLALEAEKRELDGEKSRWEERGRRLERYNALLREVKPLFDLLREEEKRDAGIGKRLEEAERELETGEAGLVRCETEYRLCREAVERGPLLEEEARSLTQLLSLLRLEEDARKEDALLAQAAEEAEKAEAVITELREKKNRTGETLASLEERSEADRELSEAETWYVSMEHLRRELDEVSRDHASVSGEAASLLSSIAPEARSILAPLTQAPDLPDDNPPEAFRIIEERKSGISEELAECEAELHRSLLEKGLSAYRGLLVPGEPCPLCGSPDHPHPHAASEEDGELREKAEEERKRLIREGELLEQALRLMASSLSRHELFLERKTALGEKKKQLEGKLEEHRRLFRWDRFSPDNRGSWERESEEAGKRRAEAKRLRVMSGEQEKKLHTLEAELRELSLRRTEAGNRAAVLSGRLLHLRAQIPEGIQDTWGVETAGRIEARISAIEAENRGVRERFEAAEKERELFSGRLNSLRGLVKELERSRIETTEAIGRKREALAPLLVSFGFGTEEALSRYFKEEYDPVIEQSGIEEYRRRLHLVTERLKEIREQVEKVSFDEEKYSALVEELPIVESRRKELWEELATFRERLEQTLRREGELRRLGKELKGLDLRHERLTSLLSMMKGNGFVRFVSVRYLRELCSRANERFFTLTGKSLALEVDDSGEFLVRDYLNGGKTRSVKTLSGGQTFQASFSLAIALSESVRKERESFFFLDEGFGSLDRDSLSLVFETLKSLRAERSIVGVISHVEAMKEEIDTALLVKKDPARGSVISYGAER
jgi:exonuclease SbcC